jgi:hypothetical protein
MVIADSGIQGFAPFQAALATAATKHPLGMLIAFYPRNSFGKKEGIDCAEELSHLDPTRNNSLFFKHRTLHPVRQQNRLRRAQFHHHVMKAVEVSWKKVRFAVPCPPQWKKNSRCPPTNVTSPTQKLYSPNGPALDPLAL